MRTLLTAALCVFALQTTDQSQSTPVPSMRIVLPSDIQWQDEGGGFFHANMLGNPDNPGFYVSLNKAKDGTILHPHWHSRDENLIVLSGTFLMGIGENFDEHALKAVPAGGYIFTPANVRHFCKTREKQSGKFLGRDRSVIPWFLHQRCKDLRRCLLAHGP